MHVVIILPKVIEPCLFSLISSIKANPFPFTLGRDVAYRGPSLFIFG